MAKHKVEKAAPKDYRIPDNIPDIPKFKTILIDAPWETQQSGGSYGANKHYNLMTTERIKELPIPEIADENAHLWMWVTNASLPDGLECIRHWNFIY